MQSLKAIFKNFHAFHYPRQYKLNICEPPQVDNMHKSYTVKRLYMRVVGS